MSLIAIIKVLTQVYESKEPNTGATSADFKLSFTGTKETLISVHVVY